MRVNVEDKMLADPRFKQLGQLIRSSCFDAFGRCLVVWMTAQQRRNEFMTPALIDALAERPGFAEAMIEADLAVHADDGLIRLRGLSERLTVIRELDRKRELANQAKADKKVSQTTNLSPRQSRVHSPVESRGEVPCGVPPIDQDQDQILSGSGSGSGSASTTRPELPDPEAIVGAERDPGGPRSDRRRKLMTAVWQYAYEKHYALKRSGIDPSAPNWPGIPTGDSAVELGKRIDSLLGDPPDWGETEAVVRRRVDVAAVEAKREGRLDWFTPSRIWAAKSFEIGTQISPEQAARPRGARASPGGNADPEPRRFKDL